MTFVTSLLSILSSLQSQNNCYCSTTVTNYNLYHNQNCDEVLKLPKRTDNDLLICDFGLKNFQTKIIVIKKGKKSVTSRFLCESWRQTKGNCHVHYRLCHRKRERGHIPHIICWGHAIHVFVCVCVSPFSVALSQSDMGRYVNRACIMWAYIRVCVYAIT